MDAIHVLTLLLCISGLVLAILLSILAVRALRLVKDIQGRLDNEVSPLIAQTAETLARVNRVTDRLSHTLDLVGSASQFAGTALARLNPVGAGQAVAVQTGRTVATWVAGLAKAAIAARQRRKAEQAGAPERQERP